MHFSTIFAIASALTLVAAAPTPAPESSPAAATPAQLFKRKECPSNYASKGVCNGTSCMWGLVNYDCGVGSCVGAGAGDGSCCGWPSDGGVAYCPNGGF
ncbi:hypothetical protein K4K57_011827 [Colletotrichum sp. SAR 10_99]|nr:hypothetical protein KHU50_011047 [Colletotrichum sp. SAR 10_65]KAI8240779.1 hypothetical protein K4K55_000383 [Colletotrichum sp. SAR 10_96]KAI8280245.1 hypothetical protein K4K56_012370 [Colletotrichum sp. SAR 10_98]KAJ5016238.1 hypothetical protein K4K57_011827 [Colletotrichum sp. SAR 10_99]